MSENKFFYLQTLLLYFIVPGLAYLILYKKYIQETKRITKILYSDTEMFFVTKLFFFALRVTRGSNTLLRF